MSAAPLDAAAALAWLRTQETMAQVLPLHMDSDLQRLVLAWPTCAPPWQPPRDTIVPNGTARRSILRWLWSGCQFDLSDLASHLGLPHDRTMRAVRLAVSLQNIYPDGSTHGHAPGVLGGILSQRLGIK